MRDGSVVDIPSNLVNDGKVRLILEHELETS